MLFDQITLFIFQMLASAVVGFLAAVYKLGKYEEKISSLEGKVNKLEDKYDSQAKQMAALEEFKVTAQKFIDSKIYSNKSPLSLTSYGQQLIQESGFLTVFEQEKNNLFDMLQRRNPRTKYDVQEMSRVLMDELVDYPPFQPIKSYAFEHGTDYGQILRAGAIPLRDYFLERHPEIIA